MARVRGTPASVSTMLTQNREAPEKDSPPSPADSSTARPRALSSANTLPSPSCLHPPTGVLAQPHGWEVLPGSYAYLFFDKSWTRN